MSLRQDLIAAAADAFDECMDPFCGEWLSENAVTADECIDLSILIGMVLRGYLHAPVDVRRIILTCGVTKGDIPGDVISAAVRTPILLDRLKRHVEELARG